MGMQRAVDARAEGLLRGSNGRASPCDKGGADSCHTARVRQTVAEGHTIRMAANSSHLARKAPEGRRSCPRSEPVGRGFDGDSGRRREGPCDNSCGGSLHRAAEMQLLRKTTSAA